MKKKILVIALIVAMVTLPISTVFAKKPEKIPLRIVGGPVPGTNNIKIYASHFWKSPSWSNREGS